MVSHVLLPAGYVPRRAYSVEVIGAALLGKAEGRGHREIAAELDVPADTVRGWLRGLHRGATSFLSQAVTVAASAGTSILDGRSPGGWLGPELAEALSALGVAARAFAPRGRAASARPRPARRDRDRLPGPDRRPASARSGGSAARG